MLCWFLRFHFWRQFGSNFAGVVCCCELPGNFPPRWEAALASREQTT